MIEEAKVLGAAPQLRIDAVKSLQQRWQAEAQAIPLERKHEQKLWDAFRKPIDEAFNRKGEEREKAAAALSEHDRVVLEASKALEAANATGDAHKIKAAMNALEAALRGQAQAAAAVAAAGEAPPVPAAAEPQAQAVAGEAAPEDGAAPAPEAAPTPTPAPKAKPKPVVAMRGDNRPGMKKTEPAPMGRGGKFGDRKGPGAGKFGERRDDRGARDSRFGDRGAPVDRGPRLGDVAFRAQREALEHAQSALRKLAAQAHGEVLAQLVAAWEKRSPDEVPSQQELGKSIPPAVRGAWVKALGNAPSGDATESLLRLEIAAETPTPAEHLDARRQLQLKLLTRRNDPSPAQTWGEDTARVLESGYDPTTARRLQNALKILLRR
jgi:ATP-dependent RNA helicase SUPV3L1/SUV3